MSIKNQFNIIKDNWLIVLVLLIVVVVTLGGNIMGLGSNDMMMKSQGMYATDMAMSESASYRGGSMPGYNNDFAPEVEERKIVKTTSLSTEVEKGAFQTSEDKLKAIVTASDSYILNTNTNKNSYGNREYMRGYYQIKVDTAKYDAVVSQLKEIGEIQSFNENENDITGSYTNREIELQVAKDKLLRYQNMYEEAEQFSDKLDLNDRIFNQERAVKYLEDSINNMDQKVEYSTISFTLSEKQGNYANIALAQFSDLIKSLVSSFNGLLYVFFVVLPWAVAITIITLIVRIFRKRKQY